jgi:hypothetical protein
MFACASDGSPRYFCGDLTGAVWYGH